MGFSVMGAAMRSPPRKASTRTLSESARDAVPCGIQRAAIAAAVYELDAPSLVLDQGPSVQSSATNFL